MASPINDLSVSIRVAASWTAQAAAAGTEYSPTTAASSITKSLSFTTGTTTANKANQLYSAITSIAAGGNTTFDIQAALTNVLGVTTATFARVKVVIIRLLSTTDDATNGTAASSITVGNATADQALVSVSGAGGFGAGSHTFTIPNGGFLAFGDGSANGIVVDGTHSDLKIVNNDGSVTAKVQITMLGADA